MPDEIERSARAADLDPSRIPRHIAVIMDGNGRWATNQGLPRSFGHRAGAKTVRRVLSEAARLGVQYLTLYSFSSENWRRPADEVRELMELCVAHCNAEREELQAMGARVRVIGRRAGLPADVLAALDMIEHATAGGTRITLCLAINYGSRAEIADAARAIARDVAAGRLTPDQVDESEVQARLYTAGMPDPDLLIRTAGEMRVSNYLLWQISYAELHVTPALWPDFTEADLHRAVRDYASRNRKFGAVSSSAAPGACAKGEMPGARS